jgi:hypothetical protein
MIFGDVLKLDFFSQVLGIPPAAQNKSKLQPKFVGYLKGPPLVAHPTVLT